MRLDVFLKRARLVRQRQLAKQLCDAGAVWCNAKPAKPSQEVHPGDHLRLQLPLRDLELRVRALPQGNVSRGIAAESIEILVDRPADRIARVFGADEDGAISDRFLPPPDPGEE
ncbi:MAG TPA: S4 domain-containing protein [Candidatus Krumholzibacteria bacterium]|nr:S4 domain-containing protein [Candidatus Krumholzibacteria bacterium]